MCTSVILVFGISGVGKTRACSNFVSHHPEYLHFKASDLLSEALKIQSDRLRLLNKSEIESNQYLLSKVLAAKRKGCETRPVIIEAHSIIDSDAGLVAVPVQAVQALSPTGLIFIKDEPENIYSRRQLDARKRPNRSIEHLRDQQLVAEAAVKTYSKVMALPLLSGQVVNSIDFERLIHRITS